MAGELRWIKILMIAMVIIMALSFGGLIDSKRNDIIVREAEVTNAKLIHHNFTVGTEELIYTVPAGKTLFITKILLISVNSPLNWYISIDDNTIWIGLLDIAETKEINFSSPLIMKTGQHMDIYGGNSDNNYAAIVGWEI